MIRVLSIDGGGLRGAIALRAIADIEQRTGQGIENHFNLIAGTSTGAIIAVGITYSTDGVTRKYTTDELLKIYETDGWKIFNPLPYPRQVARRFRSLVHRRYSSEGLQEIVKQFFSDGRISNCIKPLLVPYYDLRTNRPLHFLSRDVLGGGTGVNPKLSDVLLATTAAPTYLASHKFMMGSPAEGSQHWVQAIDGGVFANNPVLLALAEVYGANSREYYLNEEEDTGDVYVLSIGTGRHLQDYASKQTARWGIFQWGSRLFDTISQASSIMNEGLARSVIVPVTNYLRLDIDVEDPKYSEMDKYDPKAFVYWKEQYDIQIKGNRVIDTRIDDFLKRSGITGD